MQRFAGDNPMLQQMHADFEANQRRMEQSNAENVARIKEQTARDVAAAYGHIIPFS
jgi:tetrahydromethanopterin S-methyltransferase subunit G